MDKKDALLFLSCFPFIGCARLHLLKEYFGSYEKIVTADMGVLLQTGMKKDVVERFGN